jgi:hypothetical protein
MLLMVLFLSVSILQLAHAHKVFASENENITTDSVSIVEKCEICDFIFQKQSKHLLAYFSYSVIVLSTLDVSYNCNSCIYNYEFTLQGFTNKGPPTLYS